LINATSEVFTPANPGLGFLDTLEPRFYVEITSTRRDGPSVDGLQQVPYFEQLLDSSSGTSAAISEKIEAAIEQIKRLDKGALLSGTEDIRKLLEYYSNVDKLLEDVPYGMFNLSNSK
jgi:hypothetical protein